MFVLEHLVLCSSSIFDKTTDGRLLTFAAALVGDAVDVRRAV